MPATVTAGLLIAGHATAGGMAVAMGATLAIDAGIVYGLSSALKKPSTSRAGSPNFSGDRIYNTESTLYPIPIAYGRFKMGGNIIRRHVSSAGVSLHVAVGLCKGPIESIEDPEVNDRSWADVAGNVGFDEVDKYYGTDDQEVSYIFIQEAVIGTWSTNQFTRSSGRSFVAKDVNNYFITADGFYKITTVNSANLITCDSNGSGTTGYVDVTKDSRTCTGTWTSDTFTRTKGRRFKAKDELGWLQTSSGEWQITAVDTDTQTVTLTGGSYGTGSQQATVSTRGFSQAYRRLAYMAIKLKASNKTGSDPVITTIIEGKNSVPFLGRIADTPFQYAITGGSTVSKTFTIAGDHTADFLDGEELRVAGSDTDENDGDYTINGNSTYGGGATTITVDQTITNTPTQGYIQSYGYTRNPARIIADFLVNEVGEDSADIDVASFQVVETYCNATGTWTGPRYTLDILVDAQKPVIDILEEMLTAFSGALIRSNGKIKLLVEKAEASSSFDFTEDNIVEDSFSFWRVKDRINQVKITMMDEDSEYAYETIIAKDDDDIVLNGVIEKEISAAQIVRKDQASRLAQFMLDKAMVNNFFSQLKGGMETSKLEPLDVVTVTHSMPGWSGKYFRIISIQREEDGQNTFTMETYNGDIYHDRGVSVDEGYFEIPTKPDEDLDDVANLAATEGYDMLDDGTVLPYFSVSFDVPEGFIYWNHCKIYYSRDGGTNWVEAGISSTGVDFRIYGIVADVEYAIRAVCVNWAGAESDFDTSPEVLITWDGKPNTVYPSNVSGMATSWTVNGLLIYWNPVDRSATANLDFAGYEIRRNENTNWGTGNIVTGNTTGLVYRGTATEFVLKAPTSNDIAGSNTYYLKAFNTSRVYSQTADSETPAASAPSTISGLAATAKYNGVSFKWTESSDALHKDYYVRYKITSGGSWVDLYIEANQIDIYLASGDTPGSTIYIEVKDRNIYLKTSASAATANSAATAFPDADFKASDLDVPLYKFEGANTYTGNSSGLQWNTFIIYYQGKEINVNAQASYLTDNYYYTPDLSAVADGGSITLSHTSTDATFATAMKQKHQWPVFLWDTDNDAGYMVTGAKIFYVGFLKVNNLSALSANLGTVTAGTMTGMTGTFNSLTAQSDFTIGEMNADGSGIQITDETYGTKKVVCLRAKAISGSNYNILKIWEGFLQCYTGTGGWPAESGPEVSIGENGVTANNIVGGVSGSDAFFRALTNQGCFGLDGGALTITYDADGDASVPVGCLVGTVPNTQINPQIKVGTYLGNGAATQGITGVGFQPDAVMVIPSDSKSAYIKTPGLTSTNAKQLTDGSIDTDNIRSLDADGFTVGDGTSGENMNESAIGYSYIAWRD